MEIYNKIVKKIMWYFHITVLNIVYRKILYFKKREIQRRITKDTFPVHLLIRNSDFKMSIISIYHFLKVTKEKYEIFLHEDGSLSNSNKKKLNKYFSFLNLILRSDADKLINKELKSFPYIINWRSDFNFALKLIDLSFFSKHDYYIYLDADVLFFKEPHFIEKNVKDSFSNKKIKCFFNKDIEPAYIDSNTNMSAFLGFKLINQINAGLSFINKKIFDYDYLNNLISSEYYSNQEKKRKHVSEQTLYAILSSKQASVNYLPVEYDVDLNKNINKSTSKHYVGKIRHKYSIEGLINLHYVK